MKRKSKLLTIAVLSCVIGLVGIYNTKEADATAKPETVDIRIIGTTDLHGQLNSKDYEMGVDYNNGGLARVMDLITKTRAELPKENTVTLDAGDVLYDYTTEYIFSENQNEIQPIYKAMAMIGYDAITLGNHDFDYGYDYILKQLNESGMKDVAVVSNVTDSKTGKYPFLENMLITRKVKTSAGKEIEVKIGIIGQTIPTLTGKTHSYVGILKGEDMVQNAKTQAAKLKDMGADIVIALSHTGIGPVDPELNFKNVAYALTKIPEIDVVVCGHEHNLFPTTDMTSPYYKLPNVDKSTSLMNGKNVIMAGDRGEAVGVVDLTLELYDGSLEITDRSSELRMVTANSTKENSTLAGLYGEWEDKLLEYSTEIIGELKKGMAIQNFYGLLGDNAAIQLLNDSKIAYALKFTQTTGKEYQGYPIVAASTYASYGAASVNDYINIKDKITESDLTSIQPYNNYLYIYTITGKQLKEWLEWPASAYEIPNLRTTWKDPTMSALMKENNLQSLIREEWLNDWSSFYVFDGIDYEIDPSVQPRYDLSGNRINTTRRVKNVKYNGSDVTDDMKFLIATNKLTIPTDANSGVEKQVALNGFNRSQSILSKYMKQLSKSGDILPQIDNNWSVKLPYGYRFLMKAPSYADELVKEEYWFDSYLTEKAQYKYYSASYPTMTEDKKGPNIVTAPLVTGATASPFNVAVTVSDESAIKQLRMAEGRVGLDYTGWPVAKEIKNNAIKVWENGTYTVFAEDVYGNKTVKYLVIDNFDDNLLSTPTVDSYTNRKSKISGTAEPNSTIIFEAYTGRYKSKVGVTGKYSYALPSQPSGSMVYVSIIDEARGLESERVPVLVKRTGPNQPTITPVYNNTNFVSGDTKDTDASIIAIMDEKVYVPKNGGKELYEMNTEIYNPELEIVETTSEVSGDGTFFIVIPNLETGKTITIYSLDHIARNSRQTTVKVAEAAPNAPVVYEVSNIEKTISGYIPDAKGKTYEISLKLGDKNYTAETDTDGHFDIDIAEQLKAGQTFTVTASDQKNGNTRQSYSTKVIVKDIKDFVKTDSTNLTLSRVTTKSSLITGYYYDGGTVYIAISEGTGDKFQNELFIVETDDIMKYSYELDEKLKSGTTIYVMTRFKDGNILLANTAKVIAGRPEKPGLNRKVTNTDKEVEVIADRDCTVSLTVGNKTYQSKEYKYDQKKKAYIYTLKIDRELSGTEIKVTASNQAGKSDLFTSVIEKTAPESPTVNTVKAGAKKVSGKIELLDYEKESNGDTESKTEEETIPKKFKDAPSKVAKTQTSVYAQIGNKTYEGTIDNKGIFTIKTPELKAGTVIKVWGTNKAGRGPLISVKVVK